MMKRASSANCTHLSAALQRVVNELRENTLTELSLGQNAQFAVNYYTALRLQVFIASCTSLRRLNLNTRHVTTQALTVLLSSAAANHALTIMPQSSSSLSTSQTGLSSHYTPVSNAKKELTTSPLLTINIVGGLNVMESKALGAGLSSFNVVILHNKQEEELKQRQNSKATKHEYGALCANKILMRNARKMTHQHSSCHDDELADRNKNHLYVFDRPPRRNAISAPVRIAHDKICNSDEKSNNNNKCIDRTKDKRCNSKEVQMTNGGVMWRLSPVHASRESHNAERAQLKTPQTRSRCSSSQIPPTSRHTNSAKRRMTSMNDIISRHLERQHCKHTNGKDNKEEETKPEMTNLTCRVKLMLELQQLSTVSAGYVLDGLRQGNRITSFHLQLHTLSQETRSAVRYIQCHINQILERNKKLSLHAEEIHANQLADKQLVKHHDVKSKITTLVKPENENERQSYSEIFLREREAARTKKPSDCITTEREIHRNKKDSHTTKVTKKDDTQEKHVFALPHTPVTSPRCFAYRNIHRVTEQQERPFNEKKQQEHWEKERYRQDEIQNSECNILRPHTPSPRVMKHKNTTYIRKQNSIMELEHNANNHYRRINSAEKRQTENKTEKEEQRSVFDDNLLNNWHPLHRKQEEEEEEERNEPTPSPLPRRPPPQTPFPSSWEQLTNVDKYLWRDDSNNKNQQDYYEKDYVQRGRAHSEENDIEQFVHLPLVKETEEHKKNMNSATKRSDNVHKIPTTPREKRQCELESSRIAHIHHYHHGERQKEMSTLSCSSSSTESSRATSESMISAISLQSDITPKSRLSESRLTVSPSSEAAAVMWESYSNIFLTGLCIDSKQESHPLKEKEEELLTPTPPPALPAAPPPSPIVAQRQIADLSVCESHAMHKEEQYELEEEEQEWRLHEKTASDYRWFYGCKYVGMSEASAHNGITPVNEQNICSQSPTSALVSPRIQSFQFANNVPLPSPEIRAIWPNSNDGDGDEDDVDHGPEHVIQERTSSEQHKVDHANKHHSKSKPKTDKDTKKSSMQFVHTICTTPPRALRMPNKCKHANTSNETNEKQKETKKRYRKKASESMVEEVYDQNRPTLTEEHEEKEENNEIKQNECMSSRLNLRESFSLANVTISASPSPPPPPPPPPPLPPFSLQPEMVENVNLEEMPIKSLATASEIVKRAENIQHQHINDDNNDSHCKVNNLEHHKKNNNNENDNSNVEYTVTQNAIAYIHERVSDINNVLSEYQVNAAEQIQRVVEYVESWNSNLSYTVTIQLSEIMMVLADIQRSAHTAKE